MMNGHEISLSTTNLSRFEQCKERIQGIFDVELRINVQENEKNTKPKDSDTSTVTLQFSPKNSPENVKKTIKYIRSFIGEDPDLKRTSQKFSPSEFNMLLKKHDLVEKISQTYLEFLTDLQEIRSTGSYDDICLAQSVMNAVLDEASKKCSEKASGDSLTSTEKLENTENINKEQKVNLFSSLNVDEGNVSVDGETFSLPNKPRTIGQNGLQSNMNYYNSQMQDVSLLRQNEISPAETMSDTSLNWSKLPTCDLSSSSFPLDSSSQDDANESESALDKLHAEPGYSDKLEFAIKLGYTEENLLVALRKLGHSAGQNELLSELIKLDSARQSSDDKRIFSEDDLFSSNEPTDLLISPDRLDEGFCEEGSNLRPIVIDGSNVAMSHGNKAVFSCRGIKLAVDWFRQYGHREITVFVPQWRKEISRPDAPIKDQDILMDLEKEKILVFTPARRIGGKRVVCYDDRYILKLAAEVGGIVVSNDNYRDLLNENPEYRKVVEERLLMYSFVNDRFMPPDDPLGRHGPSLENFLRKEPTVPEPLPPPCPYGSKKCTYGNKCKFYHPERGNLPHKSVTEKLAEQAKQKIQEVRVREAGGKAFEGEKKQSLKKNKTKQTLQRTSSLNPTEDSTMGSAATKADRDEQYRLYEERLNDLRKQFELAEIANTESESTVVSNPEPVLVHPGYIDPLPLPTQNITSASSSPIPRVETPPQIVQPKQEQLISGHLLLAKKLSDESIDHKFGLKENGDSEDEDSSHHAVTDQSGHLAVASQIGHSAGHHTVQSKTGQGTCDIRPVIDQMAQTTNDKSRHLASLSQSEYLSKQAVQQPSWQGWSHPSELQEQQPMPFQPHSKLSRQVSVSGNQDMRLHPQFQHQMSFERQTSNDSGFQTRSMPLHKRRPDLRMYSAAEPERISSFPLTSSDVPVFYSHPGHGRSDPAFCNMRNDEVFRSGDHSFVSRMYSTPNYEQVSTHRGMVRQNSSSDSQLHMIGGVDADPYNAGYSFGQGNVPYGMDMATPDPSTYPTNQQPHYFRSTSMVAPQCRSTLASRSARHFSDGRYAGGFEQPPPVNNPYVQSSQLYNQSQPQYLGSDQIQQQFNSPQVQRVPSYQHVTPVQTPIPDPYTANPYAGQQPPTPSVWSELPPNPPTSQMRTPMPEEMEIKPTDTRYYLYYNLCSLFPEPKVRAVMNKHPNETNPQELCAYIIGAKQ